MKFLQVCMTIGVCAALAACSPEQEPAQTAVRPVKTVAAQSSDGGQSIVYTGEIAPRTQTGMGFKSGGRVIQRLVDIGDVVQPGDVLARLDRLDFDNQLRSAEADLTNAQAALATADAALKRQRMLLAKGLITKTQIEAAQSEYDGATARLAAALANRDIAKDGLTQTDLVATGPGVVTDVQANPGQVVAAGQIIMTIASTADPEAVFDLPEQLVNAGLNDPLVKVSLLSNPDITASGKVREISPMADPATRTYRVRVRLDNAPSQMMLGAAVSGTVLLAEQAIFEFPASAVTSADGRPAVYVFDPSSQTLARRPVKISYQNANEIFVTEGVAAGDRVVTAGVSKLRPGQSVRLEDGVK